MKLTYQGQLILSAFLIILANVLTEMLSFWIYRSIGFGICGFLWMIHPVVPNGMETNKQTIFWTRIAGIILIFLGIFTRVHI